MLTNHCYQGDCRAVMRSLIAAGVRVQCIVTSPPYWGLRDYGHPGQLGQEPTLREFLANMVEVFDLCRELLADDGTLWLNMGDSYAGSWGSQGREYSGVAVSALSARQVAASQRKASGTGKIRDEGIKTKDLMGQPWRLAFALQDAGWWLRQDIVWHKPNPMPESVRDRCTKAHEYLFLMTRSDRYYFDTNAIKEPATYGTTPTGVGFGHGYDRQPKPRVVPAGWDTSIGDGGHGAYHRDGAARGSKRNSFARETKYSSADHGQKAQHRPGARTSTTARPATSVASGLSLRSRTAAPTSPRSRKRWSSRASSPAAGPAISSSTRSWARARWPASPSGSAADGLAPN